MPAQGTRRSGGTHAVFSHRTLKSLLGAWALAACSAQEAAAVEHHLGECGACAEEAVLLRDAVGLLHQPESLDLDPRLRARVLEASLARRPARLPVPGWAAPYDAETARLDALLQDIGAPDWQAPVRLRWYENGVPAGRTTTVAAVLGHLLAVDGLVAVALGLADPLGTAPGAPDPVARTETYWHRVRLPPTRAARTPWREQSHRLVRAASRTARDASHDAATTADVHYGDFVLPLRDALLERAFECWIHASDIATAVDYPYGPPVPRCLHRIIDLTARRLPTALTTRAGAPGALRTPVADRGGRRMLRLEIEGAGGGEWLIPLDAAASAHGTDDAGTRMCAGAGAGAGGGAADGMGAGGGADAGARRGDGEPADGREVAHIALDGFEFCRLAAGHISPDEATAGSTGDGAAIWSVLTAVSALSRM